MTPKNLSNQGGGEGVEAQGQGEVMVPFRVWLPHVVRGVLTSLGLWIVYYYENYKVLVLLAIVTAVSESFSHAETQLKLYIARTSLDSLMVAYRKKAGSNTKVGGVGPWIW